MFNNMFIISLLMFFTRLLPLTMTKTVLTISVSGSGDDGQNMPVTSYLLLKPREYAHIIGNCYCFKESQPT